MKWLFALLLFWAAAAPQALQAAPVVLFDEGHGQRFHVAGGESLDLSSLGEVFETAGYEVRVTEKPLTATSLTGADALVVSGAFAPLTADELAAIRVFAERGGSIAVMLHTARPLEGLLTLLGVDFSNGTLRDESSMIGDNPRDFRVQSVATHPLTAGIKEFAVYGAWALRPVTQTATEIARTSPKGWVDLNRDLRLTPEDAVQSFAVAVSGPFETGRFVVFGDDALFQNRFLEGNNRVLAGNLARWLQPAPAP